MGATLKNNPLQVLVSSLKRAHLRSSDRDFWLRARDVARLGGLRGLECWLERRDSLRLDCEHQAALDLLWGQVERARSFLEKKRLAELEAEQSWDQRRAALVQRSGEKNDWKAQYSHIPKPRVASARQRRLHRRLDALLMEVRAS